MSKINLKKLSVVPGTPDSEHVNLYYRNSKLVVQDSNGEKNISLEKIQDNNIMYVHPQHDTNALENVFKTYSEAKKHILDNLPPASDTIKYLIKLPAGNIDASIAGNSIVGEEGCIHIDSNIILDCNDATVVTCPVKSNGNVDDIATAGFDYLYRYFVRGGIFNDVLGTNIVIAFSGSILNNINLTASAIVLNTGTVVNAGQMLDMFLTLIQNSTVFECTVSFYKNAMDSIFLNSTINIKLVNPTDASESSEIGIRNCNANFDVESNLNYDFVIKQSSVGFDSETVSAFSVQGLGLSNSVLASQIDIEILSNVYSIASGINTPNSVTFTGDYSEIHDIYAGELNLSKDVIVYNKFIVDTLGSITGKLDVRQKHKVQSVVADGRSVNVLPTTKLVPVDTSTNVSTIVIPGHLEVEGYEIVIIDTGDASVNNITIEDESGTVLETIIIANGSVKLFYTGIYFVKTV